MRKAGCERCDFTGWVCENYTDRPWKFGSDRADACDCGAGDSCPTCNRSPGMPDVSGVMEIDKVIVVPKGKLPSGTKH